MMMLVLGVQECLILYLVYDDIYIMVAGVVDLVPCLC